MPLIKFDLGQVTIITELSLTDENIHTGLHKKFIKEVYDTDHIIKLTFSRLVYSE